MGLFGDRVVDPYDTMGRRSGDAHVIKRAGQHAGDADHLPTMHGSKSEWKLMSGLGSLLKWSGERAPLLGDRPEGRRR